MALNAYLKLKGQKSGEIKGSCPQKGRENKIMVIAVSHEIVSPRDAASGLPTGKRMHKPYACLVDWDLATNKGGYASERAAQAEGEQLPDNTFGRCAIRVVVDEQPGTIEVLSWSWGASQAGKHNKTGHVTLMK